MKRRCAYCGSPEAATMDHVVSKLLYPPSKAESKVQRLTVPACDTCNHSWSDDEPHFRSILTIAGDPNPVARELWNGPILRGFHKDDGRRRFFDVWEQLRPLETPSGERHKVFPADDPRFLRVLRKIVRGLHYYHELWNPVPDDMVYVDVLRFAIQAEFLDAMTSHHRESDIFQYQFETFDSFDDIPMSSAWILRFFENREFIALVWKPTNVSRESAQQIVGRERRERVS